MSAAFTGRKITEQTREKLRNRTFSDEHRAKLSAKTAEYWARKQKEMNSI